VKKETTRRDIFHGAVIRSPSRTRFWYFQSAETKIANFRALKVIDSAHDSFWHAQRVDWRP
jgi:hypothetical protein